MKIRTSEAIAGQSARATAAPEPEPELGVEAGTWWFALPSSGRLEPADLPGYWAVRMLEASARAYDPPDPSDSQVRFFDSGSTQAFGWEQDGHLCIAFRGTEPKVRDWGADLLAVLQGEPPTHLGFSLAWRRVREDVVAWILSQPESLPLVVTGHSLGGALAVLAAFDLCSMRDVAGVFTYGAPRVGAPEFAHAYKNTPCGAGQTLGQVTWRLTHDGDPVPIVPPPLIYRHVGRHVGLDRPRAVAPLLTGASLATATTPYRPEPEKAAARFARELGPFLETSVGAQILGVDREVFARSPMIAVVLSFLGFAMLLLSENWSGVSALLTSFAASDWVRWPAAVLSFLIFQQLTYVVPRIPWLLRAAIGAGLFWLALTYVWPLMVGVEAWGLTVIVLALLLRLVLPATPNHMLDGYAAALGPGACASACEALGLQKPALRPTGGPTT
ncbi:lipase family protein [uncultured Phenylobacterium sp.]|uniref:lipase family protein n=1 Tax=uncultured Phenylobacterium sp. TaxID=349273 RepID=UPI0025F06CEF|nr:lipase family protein [uncultured Phenylobacterium sp.]